MSVEDESVSAGRSEANIILAMGEDDMILLAKAVLEAAVQKENSLRAAGGGVNDYGKSFGGTKQDTQVSAVTVCHANCLLTRQRKDYRLVGTSLKLVDRVHQDKFCFSKSLQDFYTPYSSVPA